MRNEDFDPIMALYDDAASLRELADKYRDEQGGLSSLLSLLAEDVKQCAGKLECGEEIGKGGGPQK
ncbi:MAG: hypothetical protein V8Q84_02855 [Bilophila sp.]